MFATELRSQKLPFDDIPEDLFSAIETLKKELNAVILAHYYQEPDIQDIADYILKVKQKLAITRLCQHPLEISILTLLNMQYVQ